MVNLKAVLLLTFNIVLFVNIYFKVPSGCSDVDFYNQVFTYDNQDNEIARKDVLVAGRVRKKVQLLIGVPTLLRMKGNETKIYAIKTIRSLIEPLDAEARKKTQILVILTDLMSPRRSFILKKILLVFSDELNTGLVNVVAIPRRFYAKLHDLPLTFNDSAKRLFWRSKQNLDYAFTFEYAHSLCEYYMQMEDDCLASKAYYDTIIYNITQSDILRRSISIWDNNIVYRKPSWIMKSYSPYGFIGKLIPAAYLSIFSITMKCFYNEMPVDFLLQGILYFVAAEQEQSANLFTHIGQLSSSFGT